MKFVFFLASFYKRMEKVKRFKETIDIILRSNLNILFRIIWIYIKILSNIKFSSFKLLYTYEYINIRSSIKIRQARYLYVHCTLISVNKRVIKNGSDFIQLLIKTRSKANRLYRKAFCHGHLIPSKK